MSCVSGLFFEKTRRHAVAAGDEIFRREDAGLNVFAQKIFGCIFGHGAIGSEIAAFGANHDLFAGEFFCGEVLDGCADAAFAALEAIVDGRVDDVDAGFHGGDDSRGVTGVHFRIELPEIRADTERGQDEALGFAEVAVSGAAGEAVGVFFCGFECGGFGHCVLSAAIVAPNFSICDPARKGAMNRAPTKSKSKTKAKPETKAKSKTKAKSGPLRRWIAARGRFAGWRLRGFRIEEARTGTKNLTVRPVLFAKENLAIARIAVKPAGDESEVFAEFLARGGCGSHARFGFALCGPCGRG